MNEERIKLKNSVFMEIAESISKLSTCGFTKVGAILVNPNNGRIISTGYNGTLSGEWHCADRKFESRDDHAKFADENEIHAEINAINNAAKNGQSSEGAYMYSTLAPCMQCAKNLAAAGISKVFFKEFYWRQGTRLYTHGVEYEQLITG